MATTTLFDALTVSFDLHMLLVNFAQALSLFPGAAYCNAAALAEPFTGYPSPPCRTKA